MKGPAGTLGKMALRKFGKFDFDCNQIAICHNHDMQVGKRREDYLPVYILKVAL